MKLIEVILIFSLFVTASSFLGIFSKRFHNALSTDLKMADVECVFPGPLYVLCLKTSKSLHVIGRK